MDEQPTAGHDDRGLTLPTLRFAWFTGIALVPLFIFAPAVNPLLGTVLTIVLLLLFSASLLPTPACKRMLAIGLTLIAVAAMTGWGWYQGELHAYGPRYFDEVARDNLFLIQRTLERYREDCGSYPVMLDSLAVDGYLQQFPSNYYFEHDANFELVQPGPGRTGGMYRHTVTGEVLAAAEHADWSRMRNVDFLARRCAGDFTYLPNLAVDEDGQLIATGYTILLYGLSGEPYSNYQGHLYDGNPLEHVVFASTDEEFRKGEKR